MRRFPVRAAAIIACALATTGCASLGLGDSDAKPTSADAAKTATASPNDPYGSLIAKQSTNLDGEIRRAQLLRAQGSYAAAVRTLSQLMLIAPDDPRVVGEYGKVLAQQGRSSDALAFLSRAIELQPDNWTLYSALGVTYDQLDNRRRAESAYKRALTLRPDEPTVLNNYAVSQMLAGNLDRAEELLHRAAAHGGNYPKIANNLQMIAQMRSRQEKSTGGPESAIKPAPKAIAKVAHPAAMPPKPAKMQAVTISKPRRLQPAVAAKKQAKPRVVMESVPYDPLAGKVYGKHHPAPARAASAKPVEHLAKAEAKPQAKPARAAHKSATPPLRTAADLY